MEIDKYTVINFIGIETIGHIVLYSLIACCNIAKHMLCFANKNPKNNNKIMPLLSRLNLTLHYCKINSIQITCF
jgi:hypothetical protein